MPDVFLLVTACIFSPIPVLNIHAIQFIYDCEAHLFNQCILRQYYEERVEQHAGVLVH